MAQRVNEIDLLTSKECATQARVQRDCVFNKLKRRELRKLRKEKWEEKYGQS